MQGLSEEKENRIMEVLLSSIKPEHLMLGKLLGLGAAGLVQMAVWTTAMLGALFVLSGFIDVPLDRLAPSPFGVVVALAYFLLGYAFFGTLQAAFGAITTNQREANNMTVFIVLPAFAPLWFLQVIFSDPEGTFARTMSFVPFTAPLTSLVRLGLDGMGTLRPAPQPRGAVGERVGRRAPHDAPLQGLPADVRPAAAGRRPAPHAAGAVRVGRNHPSSPIGEYRMLTRVRRAPAVAPTP